MSLSVENLSFSYGKAPVLRDVTFTAEKGELLSSLAPTAWARPRCSAACWER